MRVLLIQTMQDSLFVIKAAHFNTLVLSFPHQGCVDAVHPVNNYFRLFLNPEAMVNIFSVEQFSFHTRSPGREWCVGESYVRCSSDLISLN